MCRELFSQCMGQIKLLTCWTKRWWRGLIMIHMYTCMSLFISLFVLFRTNLTVFVCTYTCTYVFNFTILDCVIRREFWTLEFDRAIVLRNWLMITHSTGACWIQLFQVTGPCTITKPNVIKSHVQNNPIPPHCMAPAPAPLCCVWTIISLILRLEITVISRHTFVVMMLSLYNIIDKIMCY